MRLLNNKEVEKAAWDWTQMGAIVTYTKAPVDGDIINIVMHNSITGECMPMMWDYAELKGGE
jgi:hypothetical protein